MQESMIPNTTSDSSGMTTANVSAALVSIWNAIIMAPKTTNGERMKSLSVRFMPDCTWFASLVILVIIDETPTLSASA